MSFAALSAIRDRFPSSEIVVLAGKTPGALVRELKLVDRVIAVDRASLLRGPKVRSIGKIIKLAREIRRERFDLVIDLHSLLETNMLGFLSGASHRLFADRNNRSLNFLSNFRPKPAAYDESLHLSDNYLNVLRPLGIDNNGRPPLKIEIDGALAESVRGKVFATIDQKGKLIGIAPGAGNPSRRWLLEHFAELSKRLANPERQIVVFLGPEEEAMIDRVRELFGPDAQIVPGLTLSELAAAFAQIDLLISNDSGPAHLAAVIGTPLVLVSDKRAPMTYVPRAEHLEIVQTGEIDAISVDDVYAAAKKVLSELSGDQGTKEDE
jgi:ADP-heptose:LPS heptosyltransferase